MKKQKPIKRWMKMPEVSVRGRLVHFIWSQRDDGVYITTCGKANSKNFEDLTKSDEELIEENPELRCYFCSFSPRYYHAMKELEKDDLQPA